MQRPRAGYRYLSIVTGVFVTCLIISNIITVKIVAIGNIVMSAAITIFPISYIFGDILTEVYGYARSRQVIWTGFACNLLAVIAIQIGAWLPAAPFWQGQAAYEQILGYAPRLLLASFLAYLVGEFSNSFVLAKLKIALGYKTVIVAADSKSAAQQGENRLETDGRLTRFERVSTCASPRIPFGGDSDGDTALPFSTHER